MTLNTKLESIYEEAKKKYDAARTLRAGAAAAIDTIPKDLLEMSTYDSIWTRYNNKGYNFSINLPYSKKLIREAYQKIRRAGWVRYNKNDWTDHMELTFNLPGTEHYLSMNFRLNSAGATCVKIPTVVRYVQTQEVVESKIVCSDDNPDLFKTNEDGDLVFIGEIQPEVEV